MKAVLRTVSDSSCTSLACVLVLSVSALFRLETTSSLFSGEMVIPVSKIRGRDGRCQFTPPALTALWSTGWQTGPPHSPSAFDVAINGMIERYSWSAYFNKLAHK